MNHATFRQLQVFRTVARVGTLSRAAEILHLTQPSVTMQLKRLTERVGMPVLEQVGRRMMLTEAGQLLDVACREIFESMETFEAQVAELQGMKRGVLRLGIVNTAQYFMAALLARFCELYPQVEVSLEVENAERLAGRLRNNLDSIYVFTRPPQTLDIEATPFLDNPLVAVASSTHPLAGQTDISLERLSQERFIMREPGSETRRLAERLFQQHSLEIDVRMVSSQTEAIKRAVAEGMGICVLSARTLDGDEDLVTLNVEHFPIHHHWYLVHRRDRSLSPVSRTFVDYLLGAQAPTGAGTDSPPPDQAGC